jgi:hypothetical protein
VIPSWREHLLLCQVLNAALLMLFVVHTDTYLNDFSRPLQISDVLYGESGIGTTVSSDPKTVALRKSLLQGDEKLTHAYFSNLLFGEVLAGLLLMARHGWLAMAANVGVVVCYQLHNLQCVFADDVRSAVGFGEIPNHHV